MSDAQVPHDLDATVEKKAALLAGSAVAFVAAGLVAWGILEFVLQQ
jgi:hypothetical protein